MRLIGHRWKCGNVCRLMILIGRGLDLKRFVRLQSGLSERKFWFLKSGSWSEPKSCVVLRVRKSKRRRKQRSELRHPNISGDYSLRVPPVPIPNTEVKPQHADGTWLATARESRSSPDSNKASSMKVPLFFTRRLTCTTSINTI